MKRKLNFTTIALFFFNAFSYIQATSSDKFILITSLYNEIDAQRMTEYMTCLEINATHPMINHIHVIYDTSNDQKSSKLLAHIKRKNITISYVKGRPSFEYCFNVANTNFPSKNIILANADIFFNETLNLLSQYDLKGKFLALTRWNIKLDGSLEIFKQYDRDGKFWQEISHFSQDAWIFCTPLRKFEYAAMSFGSWNCDSIIAFQAAQSGLDVINPCLSIQCCHLHLSNVRHYIAEVNTTLPVKPLPWTKLVVTN